MAAGLNSDFGASLSLLGGESLAEFLTPKLGMKPMIAEVSVVVKPNFVFVFVASDSLGVMISSVAY